MGITIRKCQVHNKWQFFAYEGILPCCMYAYILRLRSGINGMLQARSFLNLPPTANRRVAAETTLNFAYQIGRTVLNEVPAKMGKVPKSETPIPVPPPQPEPEPAPAPADESSPA